MIGDDVLCLGLTRTQIQTLKCSFPLSFSFYQMPCNDFDNPQNIEIMTSKVWCSFINPKKLTPFQLEQILEVHAYATHHTHAAVLLFTDSFTADQKKIVNTKHLHRVDLRSGFDRTMRDLIKIVRKGRFPCWDGMARMQCNMLNDGWYLLDMETSGTDPLENDVISLTISYMADYEILSSETVYIKQASPISEEIEELTGITNAMLENGMTKEQAIDYLDNLPHPAPIITESYDF